MNFKKSFDRFFVFVLALSTALYFYGAKPYQGHATHKAAASIDANTDQVEHIDKGSVVPPVGTESKEEQTAEEDDEPTDTDESSDADPVYSASCFDLCSGAIADEVISSARCKHHCRMHVRLRSILI